MLLDKILSTNQTPYMILGLSGGSDSVFLFHMLKDMHNKGNIKLACVHINHGFRKESSQDELFCKTLCQENNIKLICFHAKDAAKVKYNGSQEEVGRKIRKHFFEKVFKEENADFVALAHHLDDQQETFLWRIIRGTTLSGLTCMKEKEGFYIRPLLSTTKNSIISHLKKHSLKYVEDQSNLSQNFLRNRIRHNVLPALKKCDERFEKKFSDTLKHLQEENVFLKQLTKEAYDEIFCEEKGDAKKFIALHPVLQKRLLIKWLSKEKVSFVPSKKYLNEIIRFLTSPRGGIHDVHTSWKICKKQNKFWIE